MGEDEGVLADHAQKARAGVAAHLAEALCQCLPQLDDVRSRPVGEPRAEAAILLGHFDHRGGVIADRFKLAPVADQPPVAEQRFERLVGHRPYPARLENIEDLFEGWPFRVDKTVLETGAKDPELHLRQIAVVRHRLELSWRARLGQARFKRRRAEATAGRLVDRCEGGCGHQSLSVRVTLCGRRRWSRSSRVARRADPYDRRWIANIRPSECTARPAIAASGARHRSAVA